MRRIHTAILVVAAATLVAGSPAAAASCNGNGHDILLSRGTASPGSGTTSTPVTFSVSYADSAGCPPSRVVVVIPGVGTLALSGSYSSGASATTFSRTMTLPVGSHAYSFSATSGNGPGGQKTATLTSVTPSRVVITAPTPPPTPPPTVQPAPQPPPPPPPPPATPTPTAAPTATPRPTQSPAASASQPESSPTPDAGGSTAPSVNPPSGPAVDGWELAWQEPGRRLPGPAGPLAGGPWPELPFDLGDLASLAPPVSFGVTTAGGLALFFLLVRRQRHRSPPPSLMAAAIPHAQAGIPRDRTETPTPVASAAAPISQESADLPRVSPLPPMRDLIPPLDYDLLADPDVPAAPDPHEAGIPRWLRPSVRLARFGQEPRRRRDWGD